jgi:hypothetical protein
MATFDDLLRMQRRWAESRELDCDEAGLLRSAEANLLLPLSPEARRELEESVERPLGEPGKPGALQRVHSTCALVCNAFEPSRGGALGDLAAACGADAGATELRLAAPTPLEEAEERLEADAMLAGAGARPTALHATFAEPYAGAERRRVSTSLLRPEAWGSLSGCLHLARDLRFGPSRFASLDATRVLELSLALTRRFGERGFRLLLLWYDAGGPAATLHRQELDRLRMRIGGEVDLEVRSWQAVFGELRARGAGDVGYLEALAARYFPDRVGSAEAP